MQIVIDIPKEVYENMKECIEHDWYQGGSAAEYIFRGVGKGIPLPKNHGNLIDVNRLKERIPLIVYYSESSVQQMIDSVPIVLDAEVENEQHNT